MASSIYEHAFLFRAMDLWTDEIEDRLERESERERESRFSPFFDGILDNPAARASDRFISYAGFRAGAYNDNVRDLFNRRDK